MNIQLNMNFDSLAELQAFLGANPGAAATKVASTQPSADVVSIAAAPAPVAAPVAAPIDPVDPLSDAPAPAGVDLTALRATLMTRLRALAEGMEDASALGKFINAFGVARFSELPDEQLNAFNVALLAQYPE